MSLRNFIAAIGVLLILASAVMLALDKLRVLKPPCTGSLYQEICPAGPSLIVPAIITTIVGLVVLVGTIVVNDDD